MKKRLKFVVFVLFFAGAFGFMFSCKQQATAEVSVPNLRLEFIKGKNPDDLKSSYRILSNVKKKELWAEKLHQLSFQQLPTEHMTLIKALETELAINDSEFSLQSNKKIATISIRLAEITPKEDFLQMFVTLDDYYYKKQFVGKEICSECIVDMQTDIQNNLNTLNVRLAPCNCNWTCGSGYKTTNNCASTSLGCGFLWLGSCHRRDCFDC